MENQETARKCESCSKTKNVRGYYGKFLCANCRKREGRHYKKPPTSYTLTEQERIEHQRAEHQMGIGWE